MNWKSELNKPYAIHEGKIITLKEYIFIKKGKSTLSEINRYKKYMMGKDQERKIELVNQIRKELEIQGKLPKVEPENEFNINNTKSINRKGVNNKERPTFQGTEQDWKNMTDRDIIAFRKKAIIRQAQIKAGTLDPNNTELWRTDYNSEGNDEWEEYVKKHPDSELPKLKHTKEPSKYLSNFATKSKIRWPLDMKTTHDEDDIQQEIPEI